MKSIRNFPEYRIHKSGLIESCYKYKTSKLCDEWRPVVPIFDKSCGYFIVTLCSNGKRKNKRVHRLLAEAFLPNPENKELINHIDGNKKNNKLSNLEWATPKENTQHAIRMGLHVPREQATNRAVVQLDRVTGEVIREHSSLHEAGRANNSNWQNIYKVCNGHRKHAGGFAWRYK